METALPQAGPLPSPAEANLYLNTTPRGPVCSLFLAQLCTHASISFFVHLSLPETPFFPEVRAPSLVFVIFQ